MAPALHIDRRRRLGGPGSHLHHQRGVRADGPAAPCQRLVLGPVGRRGRLFVGPLRDQRLRRGVSRRGRLRPGRSGRLPLRLDAAGPGVHRRVWRRWGCREPVARHHRRYRTGLRRLRGTGPRADPGAFRSGAGRRVHRCQRWRRPLRIGDVCGRRPGRSGVCRLRRFPGASSAAAGAVPVHRGWGGWWNLLVGPVRRDWRGGAWRRGLRWRGGPGRGRRRSRVDAGPSDTTTAARDAARDAQWESASGDGRALRSTSRTAARASDAACTGRRTQCGESPSQ